MKGVLGILGAVGLIGSIVVYWITIGDARRWLLFNEAIAESHAAALLKGDTGAAQPDALLDVQISTYSSWVLFSPHDEGHALILAYSPHKVPEPLSSNGALLKWRRVKQSWYEIEPNP